MHCPDCRTIVDSVAERCPRCGSVLDPSRTLDLNDPDVGLAQRDYRDVEAMGSGLSLDDVRFVPGEVFAERYRIIGLLGRGGMGQVYRADDLKLGEPVALKFLPARLLNDRDALARFHREVKLARQISHPNVCRVYDIGESSGHPFLSMEYIDGEDLASLLRRIGRLPGPKAVEVARQLCIGLAAAHQCGVLHRDLKPANVMFDSRGRVKISDFGLAGLDSELEHSRAVGTPAYMAPEQLRKGTVSFQSDIFSLGLVLYEIFTGERPFTAASWAELVARHDSGPPSRPSSLVDGLDPLVERVVMRCLEVEPASRPGSVLKVAAGLPGGDPLAAALAAGETPSPEMVAAAPKKGTLRPAVAVAGLTCLVLLLAAAALLTERYSILGLVHLPKSPEVLADRAASLLEELGLSIADGDRAYGLMLNFEYLQYIRSHDRRPERWDALASNQPAPLLFWYRESPEPLLSWNVFFWNPRFHDPPLQISGMATVVLSPEGRLTELRVVPPRSGKHDGGVEPRWSDLFDAAGFDPEAFTAVDALRTPPFHNDRRAAWLGEYPERPGMAIRIEAAAYRGQPIFFEIVEPWEEVEEVAVSGSTTLDAILVFSIPLFSITLIGCLWLVRSNLRSGRGDRRGALRLTAFVFGCTLAAWAIAAHHTVSMGEVWSFLGGLSEALLRAAYVWVVYLALEPFLRRRWPGGVISWNRLLAGSFRDALVGRDVLIGTLAAAAVKFLGAYRIWVLRRIGHTYDLYDELWLEKLNGVRAAGGEFLLQYLYSSIIFSFGLAFVFLLLVIVLRRRSLAAIVLSGVLAVGFFPTTSPVDVAFHVVMWGLVVLVIVRFGLLASISLWLVFLILVTFPITTDLSAWYAGYTIFAIGVPLALGIYGFRTALGGQPLLSSR